MCENSKMCKIAEKKLEKDIGMQKYRKRRKKLNISDSESTFNAYPTT
jgi:hypothetical protein